MSIDKIIEEIRCRCYEFGLDESQTEIIIGEINKPEIRDNMENKCYVLTCSCYSGEDSISVFWNESDAYKAMIEELETEITNLQNNGYMFDSSENDDSAEVHVPDSDIYYEWDIEESTIK